VKSGNENNNTDKQIGTNTNNSYIDTPKESALKLFLEKESIIDE